MLTPLPVPEWIGHTLRFAASPREKRAFATVLDAAILLPDRSEATATLTRDGGDVVFDIVLPMKEGRIVERVVHAAQGMRLRRLERRVYDAAGAVVREELADFAARTHPLPECTYVDVSAPFLLRAPPSGTRHAMYAWICDRFVAKVYYEAHGKPRKVRMGAREIEAVEVMMYPDLNDWVDLPAIVTRLSKPFLPKYHMLYERSAPHRLLRFEGPHGPPGAPEVVMTLEASADP